jgi:hypothetical protein
LINPSLKKKFKLWRLCKTEPSILKYRVSPLWPSYIGEMRTTFAKAYGIKVRCYGEHVGEHTWNEGKMKKKILPLPPT